MARKMEEKQIIKKIRGYKNSMARKMEGKQIIKKIR